MIEKVRHLVKVTHDPAAPRVVAGAPAPDEAADVQLRHDLIFDANGIVLEPYDKAALNRGKRPRISRLIAQELLVPFRTLPAEAIRFKNSLSQPGVTM